MRRSLAIALAAAVVAAGGAVQLATPPRAQADVLSGIGGAACKVLGTVGEGWWGTACNAAVDVGGKLAGGGKKVVGVISKVAGNPLVQRAAALAAILAWVLGGAKWTMDHMASVIASTTSPNVTASWFTGVYLRVEAIGLLFTVLFICAAAAEAILRSDVTLLARAVMVQLPLAALLTAVAAPLTMLLLAASDQLSSGLARVAGDGSSHFLTGTSAWVLGGLTVADPFFAVLAGGLVVAAGCALWVEMLVREIAVYVVVAMLPLVFAGMVWPARRVWAIRTIEVLIALILSKVAIVLVLALGGAALDHAGVTGVSKLLGGLALVILGAFSPWLLLRLIPMAEVASAAVGHIRGHVHASSGVRTPEAALTSRAIGRMADHRPTGSPAAFDRSGGTAGTVGVAELLEQMNRRAQAVVRAPAAGEQPGPATAPVGNEHPLNGDGAHAASTPTRSVSAGGENARRTRSADAGSEGPTMAQQPDGSWAPLRVGSPDEPIPPPPWEQQSEPDVASNGESGPAEAPSPDPQDGRLFRDEDLS
jgi:type IV secretion system protein TrbL